MKGAYVFEKDNQTYFLPIDHLVTQRLNFLLNSNCSNIFYIFYGLDVQNKDRDLEENLYEYFSCDRNYPPLDIHPMLQGDNYETLKNYPKLKKRISQMNVKYVK